MKLFNGDCLEVLRSLPDDSIDSMVTDPPAGISFMGKEWDEDKGGKAEWVKWMAEVMTECLRVLKPGAHALVWALPRTSFWTGNALDEAGFEVRDVVTHLFGTGFPKSLDISKAIDKAAGVEGEIIGKNPAYRARQLEHNANWETAMRPEYKRGPATDAAKQWAGFGTALKPACEMWFLARKPISEKTIAANVLKHGTGGLNIAVSRIGSEILPEAKAGQARIGTFERTDMVTPERVGRFPSNLLLSHSDNCTDTQCELGCAVKELEEQGGEKNKVSRFFYCAKASKSDKNFGCDITQKKVVGVRPNSGDMSGKFPDHDQRERVGNYHPTVKSTTLMSYLIKLITPPNGVVLDPFMGSGSTGVACKNLDLKFIGIEMNKEYFLIANKRLGLIAQNNNNLCAQPERKIKEMKLELAVLAGAESKEFLVNLTKQIDRLEKALKGLEVKTEMPAVTSSLPVTAESYEDDSDFATPAPKKASKPAKSVSFDEEVEEEVDEIDIKEVAATAPTRKPREKKIKLDDVNDACKAKTEAIKKASECSLSEAITKVKLLLERKFGTQSLSKINPDQYAEVLKVMAL